jgi:hypothetical protein
MVIFAPGACDPAIFSDALVREALTHGLLEMAEEPSPLSDHQGFNSDPRPPW